MADDLEDMVKKMVKKNGWSNDITDHESRKVASIFSNLHPPDQKGLNTLCNLANGDTGTDKDHFQMLATLSKYSQRIYSNNLDRTYHEDLAIAIVGGFYAETFVEAGDKLRPYVNDGMHPRRGGSERTRDVFERTYSIAGKDFLRFAKHKGRRFKRKLTEKALGYFKKALAIEKELYDGEVNPQNILQVAHGYHALAECAFDIVEERSLLRKARHYYEAVLKTDLEIFAKPLSKMALMYFRLGDICKEKGDDKWLQHKKRGENIADDAIGEAGENHINLPHKIYIELEKAREEISQAEGGVSASPK